MENFQSIQTKHQQTVAQDRNAVILRQMELSEATFPLLIAHLHEIRKRKSINNKTDVLNENSRMISELNYLCEHNLLFFLTITGQFAVIRELFQDKSEMARVMALIEEIEKEQDKTAANQLYVQSLSKTTQTTNKEERTHSNPIDWGIPHGVNAMMMYEYYEQELKRVTHAYHGKQAKLYAHASKQGGHDLEDAIKIVNAHKGMEPTAKKAFLDELYQLRENIQEKQLLWEQEEEQFNQLEIPDVNSSEKLHQTGKEYFNTVARLGLLLHQYKDYKIPGLGVIATRHQNLIDTTLKQAQKNELEFDQLKKAITARLDSVREIIQEDVNQYLDNIIANVNELPLEELDEKERIKLNDAVVRLEAYQSELNTPLSYKEVQTLLNQCNQELHKIQEITRDIVPPSMQQKFDNDFQEFRQLITLPTEGGIAKKIAQLKVESENSISEDLSQSEMSEEDNPTKLVLEEETEKREEQSLEKNTSQIVSQYKFFIQAVELVPEESRENYQENHQSMKLCVEDLKDSYSSEPEMLKKVEMLEKLLGKAESLGFSQVNVMEMKKIHALASELSVDYESLDSVKENLNDIFAFLDEKASRSARFLND